jgi:ATP-binding cassette, subfamily C (CFTR/MRP), member 1
VARSIAQCRIFEAAPERWCLMSFGIFAIASTHPLYIQDLWELPPRILTENLTDNLEANFYRRCPPETRPAFIRTKYNDNIRSNRHLSAEKHLPKHAVDEKISSSIPLNPRKPSWFHRQSQVPDTEFKNIKFDSSLLKALHSTFWLQIWTAGILKLLAGI